MTATVLINDFIEPGRVTAQSVRERLLSQWPFEAIDCTITSGGGDYYEGFEIYEVLRGFGVPVTTRIPEFCASIATVIYLAGDTRLVAPGPSRGLIHNPWVAVEGDYYGLTSMAEELKKVMDELIGFYAKNTRLDKVTLDTLMKVDTELSGEQMVQMGFATALYTPASQPAPAARARIQARARLIPKQTNPKHTLMNKLALDAIRALKAFMSGATIKALDKTLLDGTVISIDSTGEQPAIGEAVTVDGAPAPDGDHMTDDGYTITTVGGIITAIPVDPTAAEAQVETPAAEVVAEVVAEVAETNELDTLRAQNEALQAQLNSLQTAHASFQARVTAVLGNLHSQDVPLNAPKAVKAVSAQPTLSDEETARREMLEARKNRGKNK